MATWYEKADTITKTFPEHSFAILSNFGWAADKAQGAIITFTNLVEAVIGMRKAELPKMIVDNIASTIIRDIYSIEDDPE